MNSRPEISCFADFWPYYVGEHRHPACRGIHYLAGIASLALLVIALAWSSPVTLLLAPVVGYGLAWVGHFGVERNRPATLRFARWSLVAEFKMLALGMSGRMRKEVERLYGSAHPSPDAPLIDGSSDSLPAARPTR
jgi:hypothetical protein